MGATIRSSANARYISFVTAFLLLLDMMPYFWWWTQSYPYIGYGLRLMVCFLFYTKFIGVNRNNGGLILLFLFACFLFAFKSYIITLVLTVPLLFIPYASNSFIKEVFKSFVTIYCIIVGLALIAWVLLLLGIINPIRMIAPLNETEFDYYNVYPLFLVTHSFFDIQSAFRFHGPFDEPGMIGTFSALFLFSNSFDFKNWKTYVLLFSGIASFSLFFYLVLFVGLSLYLFSKRKIVGVFSGAFIMFLIIGALYLGTKDNEIFERLIWERIEWDSNEGRLSGSNRTTFDAEKFYESKRGTTEYWFGLNDYEPYRKMAQGSNSYQNIVMHYGMVFLIFYVLFFVLYAKKESKTKGSLLLFIFIFISCVYQRPQVLTCAYIFLYSCLARRETLELNYSSIN